MTHAVEMPKDFDRLGWAFAQLFGRWIGPKFKQLEQQGNIIVHGREKALSAVERGNCIIAGNHPSVIDDFITAAVFYPEYLDNPAFFIYSMPDRPILKSFFIPLWAAPLFRCIVIDREDQEITRRGALKTMRVLRDKGVISIRVEKGRTDGRANQDRPLFTEGDRRIRQIGEEMFGLANSETLIVPHYLKMRRIEEVGTERGRRAVTIPRDRLYGKKGPEFLPVELFFGEPYQLPRGFSRKNKQMVEDARTDLEKRILTA
ncbi:MAG TPA: 1-acyl-sn-glycerol-3-phosphate acyltransferase [Candidatus Paceibacterota bacterium]